MPQQISRSSNIRIAGRMMQRRIAVKLKARLNHQNGDHLRGPDFNRKAKGYFKLVLHCNADANAEACEEDL